MPAQTPEELEKEEQRQLEESKWREERRKSIKFDKLHLKRKKREEILLDPSDDRYKELQFWVREYFKNKSIAIQVVKFNAVTRWKMGFNHKLIPYRTGGDLIAILLVDSWMKQYCIYFNKEWQLFIPFRVVESIPTYEGNFIPRVSHVIPPTFQNLIEYGKMYLLENAFYKGSIVILVSHQDITAMKVKVEIIAGPKYIGQKLSVQRRSLKELTARQQMNLNDYSI